MLTDPTNPSRVSTSSSGRVEVCWLIAASRSTEEMPTAISTSTATVRSSMVGPMVIRTSRSRTARPSMPAQIQITTSISGSPRRRAGVQQAQVGTECLDHAAFLVQHPLPELLDTGHVLPVEGMEEQGVRGASRLDGKGPGDQANHLHPPGHNGHTSGRASECQ